jgi:hypothetical protein
MSSNEYNKLLLEDRGLAMDQILPGNNMTFRLSVKDLAIFLVVPLSTLLAPPSKGVYYTFVQL